MSDEEPVTCGDCGRAVPLLVPACPGCGARCPGACEAPCGACGATVDHRGASCPDCGAALDPWAAVVDWVHGLGFHVAVPVSDRLPCPTAAGFVRGRGKPAGQRADYRRPLDDGSEIHVREYADRYEVHRDRRSAQNRVGHLTRDAPLETAVGVASLSLLVLAARRAAPGPLSALVPARLAGRASLPSLPSLPSLAGLRRSGVGGLPVPSRLRFR